MASDEVSKSKKKGFREERICTVMEDLQWVAAALSPGRGGKKTEDGCHMMSDCQVKSGREEVRVDRLLPQGHVFQRQIPTQMAGLI